MHFNSNMLSAVVWCVHGFVVVAAAALQEPLSSNASVAEQGLRAIGNLSVRDFNRTLLATAGACEGEMTKNLYENLIKQTCRF